MHVVNSGNHTPVFLRTLSQIYDRKNSGHVFSHWLNIGWPSIFRLLTRTSSTVISQKVVEMKHKKWSLKINCHLSIVSFHVTHYLIVQWHLIKMNQTWAKYDPKEHSLLSCSGCGTVAIWGSPGTFCRKILCSCKDFRLCNHLMETFIVYSKGIKICSAHGMILQN